MVPILTALTNDGSLLILDGSEPHDQLAAWKTAGRFTCPQCKEPVLLKAGAIRIPHFSHRPDSRCQSRFSEGESAAHLTGKQMLYGLFAKLRKQPRLEPFLPELAQRPDLLIRHDGEQIPIEFQCSRIPPDIMRSRTVGYRSAGLEPVWLLRTPELYEHRKEGLDVYSFSSFHQQFFTTGIFPDAALLTLSPDAQAFHYFSHMLHIEGNRYLCTHRKLPVRLQDFPFVRVRPPAEREVRHYAEAYSAHREKFLKRSLFISRKGVRDPFLRNCYVLKVIPAVLPSYLGVPVPGNDAFSVHDCVWQADLAVHLKRWGLQAAAVPDWRLVQFTGRYTGDKALQQAACRSYLKFLARLPKQGQSPLSAPQMTSVIIRLISDGFLANQIEN